MTQQKIALTLHQINQVASQRAKVFLSCLVVAWMKAKKLAEFSPWADSSLRICSSGLEPSSNGKSVWCEMESSIFGRRIARASKAPFEN